MWEEASSTSYAVESFFAPLIVTSEQLQMHTGYSKTDVLNKQLTH